MLSSVSEGGKDRRLRNAGNSRIRELQRKLYRKAKQEPNDCPLDSDCESFWKKMIGKPYAGKPHVRFDEGELEIEP